MARSTLCVEPVTGVPRAPYPGLEPVLRLASRYLRERRVDPGLAGTAREYWWAVYALGVRRAPSLGCAPRGLGELGYYDARSCSTMAVARDAWELVWAPKPTPLVLARTPGGWPEVWLKLEWFNPYSLSSKDRVAAEIMAALARARVRGVVEVSSSNTGIALASIAARLGLEARVILPSTAPAENERVLRLLGARVERGRASVTTGMISRAVELAVREGLAWSNQFGNDLNFFAHTRGTGREIVMQLRAAGREPTALVAATGTSGTASGAMFVLHNYYGEDPPRFYPVAPAPGERIEGSRSPETGARWLSAIGVPYRLVQTTRREALWGIRFLARHSGLVPGVSGGSVIAAVRRLVEEGELGRGDVVVAIMPDTGFKYPRAVEEALS